MKIEHLVAPLWFAEKLPRDMDTVFLWYSSEGTEPCVARHYNIATLPEIPDFDISYPAPTMQELIEYTNHVLIYGQGYHRAIALRFVDDAFHEQFRRGSLDGWKRLEELMFPKI